MFKRVLAVAAGLAVLGLAAVVVLGPATFRNLVSTGRRRVDETVNQYVDPHVAFDDAVRRAEQTLPRRVAALRMARAAAEKQVAFQAQLLEEDRRALVLINGDLKTLAPAVVAGAASCDLRGRKFNSVADIQAEVRRLIRKRDRFAGQVEARQGVIQGLAKTRGQLDDQLAAARQALATYQADASRVQARIELVRAGREVEALQAALRVDSVAGDEAVTALRQLDERLQTTLLEQEERGHLRSGANADRHVDAVRSEQALEECRKLVAVKEGDK